jgi:hypothetical protein
MPVANVNANVTDVGPRTAPDRAPRGENLRFDIQHTDVTRRAAGRIERSHVQGGNIPRLLLMLAQPLANGAPRLAHMQHTPMQTPPATVVHHNAAFTLAEHAGRAIINSSMARSLIGRTLGLFR